MGQSIQIFPKKLAKTLSKTKVKTCFFVVSIYILAAKQFNWVCGYDAIRLVKVRTLPILEHGYEPITDIQLPNIM